jgi:hypothetical protein
VSKHSTEDVEAFVEAFADKVQGEAELTERYRPRISRGRVLYEVQLVTTHTIQPVGESPREQAARVIVETERERPSYVLGARWGAWKARRMVAGAHRRDVRQRQPWAVQR